MQIEQFTSDSDDLSVPQEPWNAWILLRQVVLILRLIPWVVEYAVDVGKEVILVQRVVVNSASEVPECPVGDVVEGLISLCRSLFLE